MSGIARDLADLAGGEAGEPGALRDEVVEVRGRHELRARPAVQVDELREEELDPAVGDHGPCVVRTSYGRYGLIEHWDVLRPVASRRHRPRYIQADTDPEQWRGTPVGGG